MVTGYRESAGAREWQERLGVSVLSAGLEALGRRGPKGPVTSPEATSQV